MLKIIIDMRYKSKINKLSNKALRWEIFPKVTRTKDYYSVPEIIFERWCSSAYLVGKISVIDIDVRGTLFLIQT